MNITIQGLIDAIHELGETAASEDYINFSLSCSVNRVLAALDAARPFLKSPASADGANGGEMGESKDSPK